MITSDYIDHKASTIKGFDLLSNVMWRRAVYLLKDVISTNEQIMVIDPCAGGGKLLSGMNKKWEGTAYEPNYGPFMYAKYLFEQNNYHVKVINEAFEFHLQTPRLPEYHLVISIPYTDRKINTSFEHNKECLKMKNYAFYVMNRSVDILQDGGIGVFALPKNMVNREKFGEELDCIVEKAKILSVESYDEYAIVIFQKNKAK